MPIQPKYFQVAMSPALAHRRPHPKNPKPLLRLEVRDLSDDGARIFLQQLDCCAVLADAVNGVLNLLYPPHAAVPPTRSVTLILRSMPGVAYTTAKDLDADHKEMHLSTDYIASVAADRCRAELLGVVRHEMVHCWQYNGCGTAPAGLIEGVADWVRLRSDLVPPHWARDPDGDWDAGYQHTAYFLDYLEGRFGDGAVMAINAKLRDARYEHDSFWKDLFGARVEKLWRQYGRSMRGKGEPDCHEDEEEDDDDDSDGGRGKEEGAAAAEDDGQARRQTVDGSRGAELRIKVREQQKEAQT